MQDRRDDRSRLRLFELSFCILAMSAMFLPIMTGDAHRFRDAFQCLERTDAVFERATLFADLDGVTFGDQSFDVVELLFYFGWSSWP